MKIMKIFLLCLVSLVCLQAFAQEPADANWNALMERWRMNTQKVLTPGCDWKTEEQWEKDAKSLKDYALKGKLEAYHELFVVAPEVDSSPAEALQEMLIDLSKAKSKLFRRLLEKENKEVQKSVKNFI